MFKSLSIKPLFLSLLVSCFAFSSIAVSATDLDLDQLKVEELLAETEAPDGVVFELIGNEGDYLLTAIKKVETYKEQLQKKFPELDIAVVSHGSEQFNLMKAKQSEAKDAHSLVQRLVADDVPVHICAGHASWRDVVPDDFPDYISVSSSGPAEIRNYQALGYTLIIIE